MKTVTHDWELHQGAAVDELIPVTGLPTTGVGVRCHIRDTLDALAPRLILSHDGQSNRRITVSAEGLRIQIGATVSGSLSMLASRNRWVYDAEVYSLTDADNVLKPVAGTVYAYKEATRESDTQALPPLASGDGRYLRIDGDQGLTPEQQAWAQHNSGTTPGGGGGVTDHGALSGLADDDHPQYHNDARGDARYEALGAVAAHAAAADPHPTYTTAAEAAAAAPVQSVAGRTGAVTLSTSDVSGLGTAAALNVPASGNAASGEVVKGSDTRLDVAVTTHAATEKTTPADDDELGLIDSAASWALKRLKWSAIKTALNSLYQAVLVSGTNIKTINGTSLLGSGNISISGGSPGEGSSGQAQYNNAGAFAGMPLWRTDANTISQHNGTTAQVSEIFNTRTDSSNYEKTVIGWQSNTFVIDVTKAGTGTLRAAKIKASTITVEVDATSWLKYIYPGDARVFCDLSRSLQYRINGSNNALVILGTGNGSSTSPIIGTVWYGTGVGFSSTGFHVCPSAFTFGRSTFSAIESGTLSTNLSADPFTITYGAPDAGPTAAKIVGHNVAILAGAGSSGASGAANGGTVSIDGGRGYGTGTDGDIIVGATRGVLRLPPKTVATLPPATTAGRRCFVSDATATTFYSVVSGGGSNFVPVFSDGTDWRVG